MELSRMHDTLLVLTSQRSDNFFNFLNFLYPSPRGGQEGAPTPNPPNHQIPRAKDR